MYFWRLFSYFSLLYHWRCDFSTLRLLPCTMLHPRWWENSTWLLTRGVAVQGCSNEYRHLSGSSTQQREDARREPRLDPSHTGSAGVSLVLSAWPDEVSRCGTQSACRHYKEYLRCILLNTYTTTCTRSFLPN